MMSENLNINIGMDEHVFICGGTGSGKTILCEAYLANVPSMVIKLDTKCEVFEKRKQGKPIWYGLNDEDVQVIEQLSELPYVTKDRIIYAPIPEEMNSEYYDELGEWVYKKGDCILWIDELMSVADSPMKYPFSLKKLYTRGRFINAVCWSCTQRPSDIPSICIANSQHYFIFNTPLPQDRKKLVDSTGCPEFMDLLPKYIFNYATIGSPKAVKGKLRL